MNIVWTEPAVDSLHAIRDYIARDNAFYAGVFVNRLIDTAESLDSFPERGREVPEAGNPSIRELLFQNYRVIYRFHTDQAGRHDLTPCRSPACWRPCLIGCRSPACWRPPCLRSRASPAPTGQCWVFLRQGNAGSAIVDHPSRNRGRPCPAP